ncbi:MAG: hypothetical protein JW924_02950 [Fusobacteriaceae bacterium]|nr:hypothetical protein [Fusobacteriaceae bacterium]
MGEVKQAEEKQNQKNAIKKQEMDIAPYKDSNGGYSLPWQQTKGMDKSTQKMIGNMQNHLEKNENQLGWLGVGNSIKNVLKNDTVKNFNEKYNPGVVNLGINYAFHINGGGSLEKGIVISKDGQVAVYRTEALGAMSDLEASANISFGFSKNIKTLEQFSGDSVYLSQSADALWNITINKSVSENCSATTFSYGGALSFSPYEIEGGKSTTEIVKEIK